MTARMMVSLLLLIALGQVVSGEAWAAVVNSVQSGTATSNGNGTTTVAITAVNPAASFLVFQARSNDDEPADSIVRGRINNAGTQVEFVRVTNAMGVSTVNIQWYVVEFSSGVSVQRGETNQSATTVNVPITAVGATSRAFVLHSKTVTNSDSDWDSEAPVIAALTSTSNLQIRSNTADNNHVIAWQVVEFTTAADISVQSGTTSLTGGTASVNVTLGTAIDVNSSFLLASFRSSGSGNDAGERMMRARIINSTTLTFDRDDVGDDISEIYWQVVELRDGSTVQRGTENFADTDGSETVAITAVDTGRAIAFASVQAAGGQAMGKMELDSSDTIGAGTFTLALGSNSISIQRNNTTDTADVGWFVVEFSNAGGATLPAAVGEWRLDESGWAGASGEVVDSSGNGLHGMAVNGPLAEAAQVCNGANLDGNNDYLEIADNALLDITDRVSVTAWIYPQSLPASGLKSIVSKDENYEFHLDSAGNIYWWWHNASGTLRTLTSAGVTLAVNNWYHIAITYDATGTQKIYINGVERASATYAENLLTNNDPLQIGADQGAAGRQFDGLIDEVRVYHAALNVAQVGTAMNETRNCITAPLAYYDMDTISSGTVADQSGNGYNGTATNGMTNANTTPAIAGDPGTCSYGVFDGNNDYLAVPTLPNLTGDFTIAGWIRPDRITGDQRILADDENNSNGYAFSLGDGGNGRLRLFNRSVAPVSVDSSVVITASTWWFVAAVHDVTAKTRRLYAVTGAGNPVLVGQDTYTGTWTSDTGIVSIGGETNAAGAEAVAQWRFDGFIDEIQVFDFPLTLAELTTIKQQTHPCSTGVDHFAIAHDNYGIHCLAETVSVTAELSSGATYTGYTGTITLDTQSGSGTWSLGSGNGSFSDATANDGLATYTFVAADNGVAQFSLSYPSGTATINVDAYAGAVRDDDTEGNLVFSPSGFTVTAGALSNPPPLSIDTALAAQTAASNFTLYLAAYGQTANDPVCGIIEGYTGSKNLNFWSTYVDPGTGTQQLAVNGGNVATTEAGSAAQAITFSNGQASITANYPDVGLMQLAMKDITTGNPDLPNGIRGASADFVVRPAYFQLSNIVRDSDGFGNPAAVNENGTVFIAAGAPFRVTVTARNSANAVTPNYGQETTPETVRLSPTIVAAGGAHNPAIGYSSGFGAFVNGVATGTDFSWDEVGIITLTPSVGDGNYLGGGDVSGTASGNVGRFTPARFNISANTPQLATQCGTFTYMGQSIPYGTAPAVTLTAVAVSGVTTENYDNAWWKLGDFSETYSHNGAISAGASLDASAAGHAAVNCSNCDGAVTVNFNGSFSYAVTPPETPPFAGAVDISFAVTDSDGISYTGNPYTLAAIGFSSGSELRSGRGYAQDVYGTYANAGDTLHMPVGTHYYLNAANGWVINSADSCTTFSYTQADNGITTSISPGGSVPVTAGAAALTIQLTADSGAAGGTATLSFTWPAWLPGTASALATFGIFRGDDRYIFWREGP